MREAEEGGRALRVAFFPDLRRSSARVSPPPPLSLFLNLILLLTLSFKLPHSRSPPKQNKNTLPTHKSEYVKEAVAEDNAGNYSKALELYKVALEYFSTHLKYEKNPKAKEAITAKFKEYLERAEYLKGVVDGQTAEAAAPPPGAAGTGAQKAKGDKAGGGDDDNAKLKGQLSSAILTGELFSLPPSLSLSLSLPLSLSFPKTRVIFLSLSLSLSRSLAESTVNAFFKN